MIINNMATYFFSKKKETKKQECIPLGCVPSAAVAVPGRGVCLPPPLDRITDTCKNITLPDGNKLLYIVVVIQKECM